MNAEVVYMHQQWEENHGLVADKRIQLNADDIEHARTLVPLGHSVLMLIAEGLYESCDDAEQAGADQTEMNARFKEIEVYHAAIDMAPETHTAA